MCKIKSKYIRVNVKVLRLNHNLILHEEKMKNAKLGAVLLSELPTKDKYGRIEQTFYMHFRNSEVIYGREDKKRDYSCKRL